jgi:hypothetical protein
VIAPWCWRSRGALPWWPGSAVTKSDITWNLETYRSAGWGNMGVIGIYGVRREEENFIEIFSPRWFELFSHAVQEARRLEMKIDLTPSLGWRMGGPHVTSAFGEQTFPVADGQISVRANEAKVKRPGGRCSRLRYSRGIDPSGKIMGIGEGRSPNSPEIISNAPKPYCS